MNQKGWVKEGFVLISLLMVFIAIGTLINPQLKLFTDEVENMAMDNSNTANVPQSIYNNLDLVIPLFVIVGVVGAFIFFIASSLNTEHEYQVFSSSWGGETSWSLNLPIIVSFHL